MYCALQARTFAPQHFAIYWQGGITAHFAVFAVTLLIDALALSIKCSNKQNTKPNLSKLEKVAI